MRPSFPWAGDRKQVAPATAAGRTAERGRGRSEFGQTRLLSQTVCRTDSATSIAEQRINRANEDRVSGTGHDPLGPETDMIATRW